jgi:hypothetical protein
VFSHFPGSSIPCSLKLGHPPFPRLDLPPLNQVR